MKQSSITCCIYSILRWDRRKDDLITFILYEYSTAWLAFVTASLTQVHTNSSACVEHVYAVFSHMPEGNKHFTTITAFTCKQSLADVHSYSYEFLLSGRSHCQRARQDVAKRLFFCLYLNAAFIFSLSHPSLPVLQVCTNPHSVSFKKTNQLLQPEEKSL